ncbi:adenine DNA glycosylase isoform X2 [Pseudophryne corroboree]|uniref:adenine DNA glycosylase isoform X2 n=1 Tax=Pseudophryne corroboree TaxID=495146 RepID=UPI0030816E08
MRASLPNAKSQSATRREVKGGAWKIGLMGRSGVIRGTQNRPKKVPISPNKQPATDTLDSPLQLSPYHSFSSLEADTLRTRLLSWYDQSKRDLPWRRLASTECDLDRRAYSVWVSEVMLQQTQVASVIDYYNKWMKKWPTVHDLAAASLEEVNEKWSGLGYYSRGRRLHEGAQKVVEQMGGQMPRTAEDLQKLLPGVGRYTAGAVASISYGQVTGVVDGNVIRVLCRLRCIGADANTPAVTDALWNLANALVDPDRPGDFNQAMMELGATVCMPKKPMCSECPLQNLCHAYRKVELDSASALSKFVNVRADNQPGIISDIEECAAVMSCPLCIPPSNPWDRSMGVANFPRKSAKKASRVEQTVTCVWERCGELGEMEYLLVQRPQTGLLAGMWEFPSRLLEKDHTVKGRECTLCSRLHEVTGREIPVKDLQFAGEVVHIFSHINQTYLVYFLSLSHPESVRIKEEDTEYLNYRWVTMKQFLDSAVSTAMKKIIKMCEGKNLLSSGTDTTRKRKRNVAGTQPSTRKVKMEEKQRSIQSFFKPTPKK